MPIWDYDDYSDRGGIGKHRADWPSCNGPRKPTRQEIHASARAALDSGDIQLAFDLMWPNDGVNQWRDRVASADAATLRRWAAINRDGGDERACLRADIQDALADQRA